MNDLTDSKKGKPITLNPKKDSEPANAVPKLKPYLSWMNYVKFICGLVAILMVVVVVIKLVSPSSLPEAKLEVLLLALAIAILLPYVSHIEALGVKVDVKEQVKELSQKADVLSAWAKASPYYSLASEYEVEGDYNLAEQYYQKSLNECLDFWPSIFGLASVYDEKANNTKDPDDYSKAIAFYHKVIALDKDNLYSYHNLASAYLKAPQPVYSPQKALECANKALDIMPSFYDSIYFKGWALNILKNFQEARNILQGIKDYKQVKSYRHWVMYELAIASSNLGISITPDYLKEMFGYAEDNDDTSRLREFLQKEKERFSESDRATIKNFLDKK
jgi:tetratricopeptide (TPR) repeat protein